MKLGLITSSHLFDFLLFEMEGHGSKLDSHLSNGSYPTKIEKNIKLELERDISLICQTCGGIIGLKVVVFT